MSFIEKVKTTITGKNELERKQEKLANLAIRKKALAAQYQERQKQQVRLAAEKEKLAAESQLRKMKAQYNRPQNSFFGTVAQHQPKQYSSPFGGGMTDVLGFGGNAPRHPTGKAVMKKRVIYVKKGKHYVRKTRYTKTAPRQTPQVPQRYDVLGSGFGGGSVKKFRVI